MTDRIQSQPCLHGRVGEDVQLLLQQGPEAPHRTKRGVGGSSVHVKSGSSVHVRRLVVCARFCCVILSL